MSDVETTGLALLTFLGAGHTHREGNYKESVRNGLKWLRSQQDTLGYFSPDSHPRFYATHGVAALAMAEAYGMTKSGSWKSSAQRGIDCVQKLQRPDGSWGGPGEGDLAATGWMVLALKSGQMAGLDVEATALKRAYEHLKARKPSEPPSRRDSALDILIRIFAGGEEPAKSPAIQAAAAHMMQNLPAWEPGKIDMVYWHFGTLAMYQVGGTSWRTWNSKMKAAIVDHERRDGNFKGSWDPVGSEAGGRIWSTTLMTLCVEVYYRYRRVFGTRK
jgi:hypothetical protein